MDQQSISKLQFYSLGIVASNKKLSSDKIEVTPVEEFPMLDGEISDNKVDYKADTTDKEGSAKSTSVKSTVTVNAKWLPINNSNRRTPPDVRRGEKVVIYKFGDTDEYWWNTLFNDSKLRRLETVIYAFSNNAKEGPEDSATSTYFLEVSTHKKLMHLHTSKSDGEPFSYDVQINAKDGMIVITDDADNFFVLNSKENRLTMQNGDGSVVDVDKTNIVFTATDSISLNSKDILVSASNETSIKSNINTLSATSNNVDGPIAASNGITLGTGSGGGTSATLSGNIVVEGNLHANGAITSSTSISSPNTN
jgi:hypothetical protein